MYGLRADEVPTFGQKLSLIILIKEQNIDFKRKRKMEDPIHYEDLQDIKLKFKFARIFSAISELVVFGETQMKLLSKLLVGFELKIKVFSGGPM